jgi:tetratricopeptide (TPR) repeat protein
MGRIIHCVMDQKLIEILQVNIPSYPADTDSFLDITVQGHNENIISRIYSYFLNYKGNDLISEMFITSLTELISEKTGKSFTIEYFECFPEVSTGGGNRVDLVIDSTSQQKAIIIENKIYHGLHNDLEDYWQYKNYLEQNKIGVLLTLYKMPIPNSVEGNFVNITHIEWINRIKRNGLPGGLSTNEYVYLNDFFNNISKLTKSTKMNEQARFFFDNTSKVLTAIETHNEAEKFIMNQLKITADRIGWRLGGNGWAYRDIWDEKSHAYYIISYEDLLSEKKEVNIIIEIYKDAIQKEEELKAALIDNDKYLSLYRDGRHTPHWIHFAAWKYPVSISELENLGDFIYEKIKENFQPVMDIILKTLSNEVSISA